MSPQPPRAEPSAEVLLDLMVRVGLANYLRQMEDPEPALELMLDDGESAANEAGIGKLEWRGQLGVLLAIWQGTHGPLPTLVRQLALTTPELFLLGLTVGCERRRSIAMAVAALQAPIPLSRPSVHLALDISAGLFDTGLGDALTLAGGKLVVAGLLTLEGEDALPRRVLAVRLAVWRALAGGPPAWPNGRLIETGEVSGVPDRTLAQVVRAIESDEAGGVVIRGPVGSGRARVASAIAQKLGRSAIEIPVATFREDRGFGTVCHAAGWLPVVRLVQQMGETASLVGSDSTLPCAVLAATQGAVEGDRLIELTMAPPSPAQRTQLWQEALVSPPPGIDAETLAVPVLYPSAIRQVARAALVRAESAGRPVAFADLTEARMAIAPEALRRLAQPVPRRVTADALIMTESLSQELEAFLARCRKRETVWDNLGPSLASNTTRGVRALFAGDPGTGKTMAAAYIATALGAPLYRCELGAVMNKYIGESEKNLGALLDYAEAADVVLLFDEADALFGRRSDASETGERYANMLTNYLLTRIEVHNGIVILTTNGKSRIDPAFWRRLDQVIDFPAPGYAQRLALWKSHLGARAPSSEVIERLAAYCDLAGGSIRNAVLAAAVLGVPEAPIAYGDIVSALRREYAKLGKALPASLAPSVRAA